MLMCSICSCAFPFHRACEQSHEGVCHSCATLNWSGTPLDNPAHDPPPASVPARSPREEAAVAAYLRHVVRTGGTGPLVELLTEEGTP